MRAYKEEGMWGSVEIGGMIGWQLIRKELPDLKIVVVRRPLQEVYNSITNLKLTAHLTNLAELNAMLDIISEQPGVHTIKSSDLDAPVVGKWLFEYCLELEFDFEWWYHMSNTNVQINMNDVMSMKEELDSRYYAYQADVMRRMEEIKSCLH